MSAPTVNPGETVWNLPPLILHPFNEHVPPATLLENSKAALMLTGLIPVDGTDEEELHRKVMTGRYAEVRMLFFLGKDVLRWLDQCVDSTNRDPDLLASGVTCQSFAHLLTSGPPDAVKEKLTKWGVADYSSIFARAIGLNALFTQPPARTALSDEFLRNYHRYADSLFRCYLDSGPHRLITSSQFPFELYASGEYSRLLESEWEGGEGEEGNHPR
jgi:hypothetical protein